MELHNLSFGQIIILRKDLAEVIVDEGVEMNSKMVDEYHEFLLSYLHSPFSLLINKKNSYTYDFEAQLKIADLKEIRLMAVVTNTRAKELGTEALKNINASSDNWNIKNFYSRDEALNWLTSN